jgi:hypothetical protein
MNFTDLAVHAANFFAPAVFMALGVSVLSRFLWRKRSLVMNWWAGVAIQLIACCSILVGGLLVFGVDGKMATYAALVLGCGLAQWLLIRGWRA